MVLVHTVMQLLGKIICRCTQALVWLKVRLWSLVSNLPVRFFLIYLSVVNLLHRHLLHRNQPVPTAQLQKKGKPVGITKSARSRTKGNKTVQTHTASLLTPAGLKSQGRVSQLLQRVKQELKKGK
jgi:hypothetical protein